MDGLSDKDILHLLRLPDEHSRERGLREFLGLYEQSVLNSLLGITQCHADIEAAVSEAAAFLYWNPEKYDPARGRLVNWFTAVARHRLFDLLGRGGARHQELSLPDDCISSKYFSSCEPKLASALNDAIIGLTPFQRAITEADIAEHGRADSGILATELGTSPESIRSNRSKARKMIRIKLIEQGFFPGV